MNFRDLKGRTALHLAVAFGNRLAAETLLFLNANPLIEDLYGQRPIDMALDDGIRELLQNKMLRSQAPVLTAVPRIKPRREIIKPKMSQMSLKSTGSKQEQRKKEHPLDVRELQSMMQEKIIIAKIGIENDNYLQYAIKSKSIEAVTYLLSSMSFDLSYCNSSGNTALHLAIKSSLPMVKLLFIQNLTLPYSLTASLQDLQGNLNPSTLSVLSKRNNKGLTPLALSID